MYDFLFHWGLNEEKEINYYNSPGIGCKMTYTYVTTKYKELQGSQSSLQ